MSQMLVRIDKKMDDALIEIHKIISDPDAGEDEILPREAICTILNGVLNQWKPNHEATLKIKDEARKKNEAAQ